MTRVAALLLILLLPAVAGAQGFAMAWAGGVDLASYSITDGLLTADVGAGAHQAHIRWDVPTVADMPDLKGFEICFGTATGDYDLLNQKDLTTTVQPGANEVLFTGLATSTAYYWRVRAIDSEGNVGSWSAEQTCTSEAAWTAPGSPTDVDQSDMPLTLSGNMRLTENVTGTVTAADNSSLDLNGFTIDPNGGGTGLILPDGVNDCRIFSSQAGGKIVTTNAGDDCVQVNGTLSANVILSSFTLQVASLLSYAFINTGNDASLRAYDITLDLDCGSDQDTSADGGGVKDTCGKWYGGVCDTDSDDGRTYSFDKPTSNAEIWGWIANINDAGNHATQNHGFVVQYGDCTHYVHDNTITVLASRPRVLFYDGGDSGGGTEQPCHVMWNTVDMTNALNDAATTTAIQVRNDSGSIRHVRNLAIKFNTIILGGNTAVTAAFLLSEDGPTSDVYFAHNTTTGIAAEVQGFHNRMDCDDLFQWGNSWTKDVAFTGVVGGVSTAPNPASATVQYFADETITGSGDPDIDAPATGITNVTWHLPVAWDDAGIVDDESRCVFDGDRGYDPNADAIPTPTGMTQISGIH